MCSGFCSTTCMSCYFFFIFFESGTFIQPATGPSSVCVGGSAVFNCTVELFITAGIGFVMVDAAWSRNGVVITASTPGHILVRTGDSQRVTGLMVDSTSLDDDGTVYNCSTDGAPTDFTSSAELNVVGGRYVICTVCTVCALVCTLLQLRKYA